jgi:hypothetical protein
VKSFRIYLRDEPVPIPERVVSDYTAEEIAAFREQFRPLVEHYRKRQRIGFYGLGGFVLCLVLTAIMPKPLMGYFIAAGVCCHFFALLVHKRLPNAQLAITDLMQVSEFFALNAAAVH